MAFVSAGTPEDKVVTSSTHYDRRECAQNFASSSDLMQHMQYAHESQAQGQGLRYEKPKVNAICKQSFSFDILGSN